MEELGDESSIHRKHQAMLERLSNRHQARQPDHQSVESSLESTTSFLSRFSNLKSSISSQISLIQQSPESFSKTDLDSVGSSIANLEKLLAENSYYLPSYEVRASLKTVSDLKDSLDQLSTLLFPRKRFAFKNRPAKQKPKPEPEKTRSESGERTGFTVQDSDSPGLRNKEGEVLVERFKGKEFGEFTVSDLKSCEVRLIGRARTVFIHRLKDSRVYAGPVLGSILIDGVEGCVFVLASHQIRIHNAKDCDFYLRVRSRPIVEDCSGVRFAPYCFEYEGIEEDLRESNLDEETGNWANVDDFKWLRAVPSPNWSILPEEERTRGLSLCDEEEPVAA